MSEATNALRGQIEIAVRDYLRTQAAGIAEMEGVDFLTRQEVTDRRFPRVVVEAVRAPAQDDCNTLFMVELMVYLGSSANEPDVKARHQARLGFLEERMGADEGAGFIASVSGHPSILVHKVFASDSAGEQNGEHFVEVLGYLMPSQVKG